MNSKHVMPLKRRRLMKTDYSKRLAFVKSGIPRAIIRRSLKHSLVNIAEFNETGDKILVHGSTIELKKFGWTSPTGNTPAAYLAGYLAGIRAKKKGIDRVIIDLGVQKVVKGSRILSCVKGLRDAGLSIPFEDGLFPDESRILGKHLKTVETEKVEQVKKLMEESL
ncbi:MAG: 50S ribosomal protein L18 [Thermoplasmatales archaeon]